MTESEIEAIARPVLEKLLGPFGWERVVVQLGEDHEGDPAIFLDAFFTAGNPPMEGTTLLRALGAVRTALRQVGEDRYPYIRLHIPDRSPERAA